jgi:CBS domain containing-hemolysin-like protein
MRIFKVLEQFKKAPVRLAMIVNEYGGLEGIVTQTDLLEAIAGDLADVEGEEPDVVKREDGSLLLDGMMSAEDAFDRLDLLTRAPEGDFHTIAGFVVQQLGHLPKVGEHFVYESWRFEVVDLDGRRIDKVLAILLRARGEHSR